MTKSPSDTTIQLPYEEVRRFLPDSSQDVKRAFATALVTALDKLNVKPGTKFVVMREEDYGALIEAQRDDIAVLKEELDAGRDFNMHGRELVEMVEDMERGMRTPEEIIEHVTRG